MIGVLTGIDIALSNVALSAMPVHYLTIAKSSSALWVMFFSTLLGILRPSCAVAAAVLLVAVGVGAASAGETDVDPMGCVSRA